MEQQVKNCQVCKSEKGIYSYKLIKKDRVINSCFECRWEALKILEKDCLVCSKWMLESENNYPETCSVACEKQYQASFNQERIFLGNRINK